MKPWAVHKFGGTSVANADCYKSIPGILAPEKHTRKAIVVSAMSGVTNALIELIEWATKRDESYLKKLESLKERHLEAIRGLASVGSKREKLEKQIQSDFSDIAELLRAAWLARSCAERIVELISGYGELWSAQFLHAHLEATNASARWLDARLTLVVDSSETSVVVDWETSRRKLHEWLGANPTETLIVTGFIASSADGGATTLKRNGSDFSATIFAALLDAEAVTIWKEVDGVMSADPRAVPDAVVLPELSYSEASELAYFGAKVVHPSTMMPAIRSRIPVYIRNTFNPKHAGTKIHDGAKSDRAVKGFATIDNMALVNLEGTGMIGVPGVAERLFGALRNVGVSVVMISQASSEHSICFAVSEAQADLAKKTVEEAFFSERHHGLIQTVDVAKSCTLLAMVGDNMIESPGIAGNFFRALGKAGVNIRAIAQGSSERNISTAIDGAQSKRALRAVHSAFYLSNQTLSIGLIGPGLIGGTLLRQLNSQLEWLKRERKIDLRVRGLLNSKKMLLEDAAINLGTWTDTLEKKGTPSELAAFVAHVQAPHLPHAVIIDASSSPEIARMYPEWLERGINIITPNKKANTSDMAFYERLKRTTRDTNKYYFYETTVGAGLPIIQTLRDLVETGDEIIQIEGVLSGTLSYIFNSFTGEKPFSEIVLEAKRLGYTEPDPRDDLSGMDVARKIVILARERGLKLEVSDVQVQSLVPEKLRGGSTEDFLARLPEHDHAMAEMIADAKSKNEALRYVAVIDAQGQARVEIRRYPQSHAFARLQGSDNIVAFTTNRYRQQPLVVQGPGAGPEVTAAGVFGDILKLASYFGAPI